MKVCFCLFVWSGGLEPQTLKKNPLKLVFTACLDEIEMTAVQLRGQLGNTNKGYNGNSIDEGVFLFICLIRGVRACASEPQNLKKKPFKFIEVLVLFLVFTASSEEIWMT